jgi:bleomycin hydrolase
MFKEVVKEAAPTQESRQAGYDSKQTTDDHLMHITGLAHDQNGTLYFLVKNSWGTGNEMQGYQYVSETYFKMKTIAITLHKEAVPSPIIKSLKK